MEVQIVLATNYIRQYCLKWQANNPSVAASMNFHYQSHTLEHKFHHTTGNRTNRPKIPQFKTLTAEPLI